MINFRKVFNIFILALHLLLRNKHTFNGIYHLTGPLTHTISHTTPTPKNPLKILENSMGPASHKGVPFPWHLRVQKKLKRRSMPQVTLVSMLLAWIWSCGRTNALIFSFPWTDLGRKLGKLEAFKDKTSQKKKHNTIGKQVGENNL